VTPKTRRTASERGSTGRRYPDEPLSRERIVSAALALVDEEGLAALSMRRLATALGVDPMAIYYYLPNKAALHDAIVEAVTIDMAMNIPSFDFSLSLYDLVVAAGRMYRASLLRHPNAVYLMVVRAAPTPTALRPGDVMVGCFTSAGLTPAESVAAVDVFSTYVTAYVLREVQEPSGPERDPHANLLNVQEALDPQEAPNLVRAIQEGNLMDFEAEFEFGLRAMARGFAEVAAERVIR
jgi:TetR/AcrR family transcriptional regulator, tetracycline repressor protein